MKTNHVIQRDGSRQLEIIQFGFTSIFISQDFSQTEHLESGVPPVFQNDGSLVVLGITIFEAEVLLTNGALCECFIDDRVASASCWLNLVAFGIEIVWSS